MYKHGNYKYPDIGGGECKLESQQQNRKKQTKRIYGKYVNDNNCKNYPLGQ